MGSGAQILGGAGGPFVAALVSGQPARVLMISIGWIALSVLAAGWLAATHRPVEAPTESLTGPGMNPALTEPD